jgi:WD40 repeat protein
MYPMTLSQIISIVMFVLSSAMGVMAVAEEGAEDEYHGVSPLNEVLAISPDGGEMAFASDVLSDKNMDIVIAERDGNSLRILTPWAESSETYPDWSPDGRNIVFASTMGADNHNIWIIGADGEGPVQLTSHPAEDHQPRWSPDGAQIAFISERTGKRELWVMDADGSNKRPVTLRVARYQVNDPAWAPDGSRLVYSECLEFCNLFTINSDGTGIQQVTYGEYQDWRPDWGDNDIIAFESNREYVYGIRFVTPEGTEIQVAPEGPPRGRYPRWDNNSGKMLYTEVVENNGYLSSEIREMDMLGEEPVVVSIEDRDKDGELDRGDLCAKSDLRPTVVIDDCESGVENYSLGRGCTIADEIAKCANNATNHGRFVSCVSKLTNEQKKMGRMSGSEKGAIQSCAGQANIP